MDISALQDQLEKHANSDKKLVISIQGCSASGKTTLSKILSQELDSFGVSHKLIQLDCYYKSFRGAPEDIENYDFDNPEAYDWDALVETLFSFSNDMNFEAVEYKYKIAERISRRYAVPNNRPEVIIVEGIYAFNLFEKQAFNIEELDAFNSSKQVERLKINNTIDTSRFYTIKIMLNMSVEDAMAIRMARDISTGLESSEKTFMKRFNRFVAPAIANWVYSDDYEPTISVERGIFNYQGIQKILTPILGHLNCLEQNFSFEKKVTHYLLHKANHKIRT